MPETPAYLRIAGDLRAAILSGALEPGAKLPSETKLMAQYGVRIVIGKGGLRADSQAAFAELGGVYLAIIGGTAALETTWIERIEDVDLDDLNPESLWKFRIRDFGPLLVAMDSHGGSLYDTVRADVDARRAAVLASLGVKEAG